MNRRNFINGMLSAVAGFSILPPAETYGRVWRAARPYSITESSYEVHSDGVSLWRYGVKDELSLRVLPGIPAPAFGSVVTIKNFDGAMSRFNGEWISEGNGKLARWPAS